MFSQLLKPSALIYLHGSVRYLSASASHYIKIGIVGAAGEIGQPFSLLCKLDTNFTDIHMHDIVKHTAGVAADISHINTCSECISYTGEDQLKAALEGMDIVAIVGSIPWSHWKPGTDRNITFEGNAKIMHDAAIIVAEVCPDATVAILTNPVNSCVPVFCEVMRKAGKFDPNKIVGVTTLDRLRASTFISELKGGDPIKIYVPVIGGHSGSTIIPLFSACVPPIYLTNKEACDLTRKVQSAGEAVIMLKFGDGTSRQSMAFSGYRLVQAIVRGIKGQSNIECCYWHSRMDDCKYFATPVTFGKNGIQINHGLPKLNDYEKQQVKQAIPTLQEDYERGETFVL